MVGKGLRVGTGLMVGIGLMVGKGGNVGNTNNPAINKLTIPFLILFTPFHILLSCTYVVVFETIHPLRIYPFLIRAFSAFMVV